jgi:phenylacetate-coenzyme A ligase PaaK-like adenylate-forming protein
MTAFDHSVADPTITRAGIEAFMAENPPGHGWYLDRYVVCKTSGSTGQPGVFVHDPSAIEVYAALLLARALPGRTRVRGLTAFLRAGGSVAVVVAPEGYSIEGVLMASGARRYPRLVGGHMRAFSVMRPLSELVHELNRFQPAILAGYSTAIAWLVGQQAAGTLHIRPLVVVTTSEWIPPAVHAQIARSFRCPAPDLYAATEFLGIAAACDRGALHANTDWLILEPVDREYRPTPVGEPSHTVLLTNLANRVQPLIRNDLGDSITVCAEPCPCGSALPGIRVEGRREDILHFRRGDKAVVPVLLLALTTIAMEVSGAQRFQFVQTAPDILTVRVEEAAGTDRLDIGASIVERLRAYLITLGLPDVRIVLAAEPPARDVRTGKYRTVWAEPQAHV